MAPLTTNTETSSSESAPTIVHEDKPTPDPMPETEILYYTYEGNFQMECEAQILACELLFSEASEEKGGEEALPQQVQLILDRTVLHAQGGGQPTDVGTIQVLPEKTDNGVMIEVTKVIMDRSTNVVTHTGRVVSGPALDSWHSWVGRPVQVRVQEEQRQLFSECQTAGHVVDAAMAKCKSVLPATKAYHFLEGPYVEYKGTIPQEDRPALLEALQQAFQDLVDQDLPTDIKVLPRDEAQAICDRVAENYTNLQAQFGAEDHVRLVTVAGWPCPCGGTHIKSTGVLKDRKWGITGFRNKKGVVRVKYGMNWKKD